MPKPHITMQDIADSIGCSVMTVSLALRDSGRVGEKRRELIKRTALKLGYRPNPLVSALMASRKNRAHDSETIALFTKFDEPISKWRQKLGFYSELRAGIVERAKELGFRIEEFPTHVTGAPSGPRLTRILLARGIRSIILFPGGGLDREYPDCDWAQFATVAAGFNARHMPVHRTATDYAHGIEICLNELAARGYRRIGFALSKVLDPLVRYAMSGRYLAWREQQPSRSRVPLMEGDTEYPDEQCFKRWVSRHKPDCVLSTADEVGKWLHDLGLRYPDDIGLALTPIRDIKKHAGIDTNTHQVGRAAVSVLARELFHNHLGLPAFPETTYVMSSWQDGPTVHPRLATTV
jgi:LacI family transcriptional regulator